MGSPVAFTANPSDDLASVSSWGRSSHLHFDCKTCPWVLWPSRRAHSHSQYSRAVNNARESKGAAAVTACPAQVPTQHTSLHSPEAPRGQR